MKKIAASLFLLLLMGASTQAFSQVPDAMKHPQGTMRLIFMAARSGDFTQLENLCDPQGESDGDTESICDAAGNPEPFVEAFKDGRVVGMPRFSGNMAEVDFLFGEGAKQKETMTLIKRGEGWYLYSF